MIAIIIIILIIIIISPISINIILLKDNKNDVIIFNIKMLFGLIRFKIEYPLLEIGIDNKDVNLKVNKETESKKNKGNIEEKEELINVNKIFERFKDAKGLFDKYESILNYVLRKTNWKLLNWKTEIGTDNAASTGLITGLVNIIKSNLIAFIYNKNCNFKKTSINTIPNFKKLVFKTRLNCIFSIKIGYIIIAGINFLKLRYLS